MTGLWCALGRGGVGKCEGEGRGKRRVRGDRGMRGEREEGERGERGGE